VPILILQLKERTIIMAEEENYREFMPGFTSFAGTKPGDILKNDGYTLTFFGVLLNGQKSEQSRGFECFYDWKDVMNIVLKSLNNFEEIENLENDVAVELFSWFLSYQGWGLRTTLLPRRTHLVFKRRLWEIKQIWTQDEEYTEEKCWTIFSKDKKLEDLVPEFEVQINEGTGRKKWINLRFGTETDLSVTFSIEKKRPDFILVNIAAAAVSEHLDDIEKIQHLEIPVTLRSCVAKMMKDVRWMSNFGS